MEVFKGGKNGECGGNGVLREIVERRGNERAAGKTKTDRNGDGRKRTRKGMEMQ